MNQKQAYYFRKFIATIKPKSLYDIIVPRTFFDSLESVQKWGEDNV